MSEALHAPDVEVGVGDDGTGGRQFSSVEDACADRQPSVGGGAGDGGASSGVAQGNFRLGPGDRITVKIARTPDDIAKAMAIRAAVFLGEEDNITYDDEFDGNDMVATHLVAYVNGDPAGTFRIRWFADFARLERLGIRRRYRGLPVLNALAREARKLCRQKGYRLASGKAREDVVPFWRRFGAKVSGAAVHMFRGTLVPLLFTFPPSRSAVISADRLGEHDFEEMLSLPEGCWPETDQGALGATSHLLAVSQSA
jgi:GNAT superfamily N-acetyltransferase